MIRAQDQDIQSLVSDIQYSKLLLPEMQRNYVWKAAQVRDLFDSLYHEYPSGQLLVWNTNELPSSVIRKASVEGLSTEQNHPQLLLDGQQRLTSLAAVMLGKPLRVRDVSRPIDIMFNVYTEKFEVAGPRQRGQTGWISLVKFFTQGAMVVYRELKLDPGSAEADEVYNRLNRLDNIKRYRYRVNILEHLDYAEVTHIFVRTNSGGTTLGYADLALAQVSSCWQGVTEVFEVYQQDVKKRGIGLKLDNGLLLRTILVLLTGQSRFTRFFRSDQQQATVDELKVAWERAKTALDQSISFLVQNCMIDRLEMLPTRSIFIPLVVFFDRYGANMTDEQARELQRWVYMALIWSRYSGSSETAMDQDVTALTKERSIRAMIRNIEDVVGHQRPVTENELRNQLKNSPYMLMAYVLARRIGAQDWFNGVVIGNDHSIDLVLHHIIPKSLLSEQYKLREDSRTVDQVANLAFLSAGISKSVANRLPSEYLTEIDEHRLKSQCVPLQHDLWEVDQFESFMLQRRKMLADAINQLLQTLSEDKRVWLSSTKDILETRIDALERELRKLIEIRLREARGDSAWDHLVPIEIRNNVERLVKKEEANEPFKVGQHETLQAKLNFCLYSELLKIIKENWVFFQDVFGKETNLEQYSFFVINARNKIKHGNELSELERASTEAGLLWLEECLSNVTYEEESEEEELVAEPV
jgi:hypothetical protein